MIASRLPRAALVVLAVVAGPLLGVWLLRTIGPEIRWIESSDAGPFWLSLRVASIATLVAGVAGISCGYLLAKGRFPGRGLLEAIGSVPIILPPTVLGYYLVHDLDPSAPLGHALKRLFGAQLVFTPIGCVIAASVAAFPFCMRAARSAIEDVDPRFEQAARAMGLPAWRIALQITIPLARRGVAAGLTLGAARAIGEYGATLMVGGNIPGRTVTMSLAVADARTTADTKTMVLILVVMAGTALIGISWLGRSRS